MSEAVIFLDFDGVIRVPDVLGAGDFCQERMARLDAVCERTGASIVVSSDWRFLAERELIERHLGKLAERFHEDWRTGSVPGGDARWMEVEEWLSRHGEVERYVILDDWEWLFAGASEAMKTRLVICSNRHGFVDELIPRVLGCLKFRDRRFVDHSP